jgi:hypothetical protein
MANGAAKPNTAAANTGFSPGIFDFEKLFCINIVMDVVFYFQMTMNGQRLVPWHA